jgi:ABC-type transport system substrate-binding protein
VYEAATKPTGSQIVLTSMSADYLDAYDIYSASLSCAAAATGGFNFAHYCDSTADTLVQTAQGLPLGANRTALLRQAQDRMLQSAAHIPVLFPMPTELVSPRVGGFYYQPLFGWRYEDYWLNP